MMLDELRRAVGRSQAQCARRMGVTERTWRRWEAGSVVVPTGRLVGVARLVGVSVGELVAAIGEGQAVLAERA